MGLRCCCLHIQLETTLHIQWHKELKLEEAALDSTPHCMSPQWRYSTSTLRAPAFDSKGWLQVPSICLCLHGLAVEKAQHYGEQGLGHQRATRKGRSAAKEELVTRNPAPVPLSVHSSLLPSLPQPDSAQGPHLQRPGSPPMVCNEREDMIPSISKWNPEYPEHKKHCYLGSDILKQGCPKKFPTMT